MVNFTLGNETSKVNWSTWHEHANLSSHLITELKILHFHSLITLMMTSSGDPSSMQDACHTQTQLNDLTLHEFS